MKACEVSAARAVPDKAIDAVRRIPRFSEATERVIHGVAWLWVVAVDRARRHLTVQNATSIHHGELDSLFGRSKFAALNRQLRILEIVAEHEGGLTRAYRLAPDIEEAVTSRIRTGNNADEPMVMVRPGGWELRKLPPTIALASLNDPCIWRSIDINMVVPVAASGMAALASLDNWLARAAAMGPACRERILRELQIEPHANVEYLRSYLTRLRCNLRAELPGRGLLASQYAPADTGRLFEVRCGLQGAPKIIKRCALDGYFAYDAENCHLEIIYQLARRQRLPAEAIEDYRAHKDDRRSEIAKRTGLTMQHAKEGLIAIMYGSRQRYDDEHDGVTTDLIADYGELRGRELAARFWNDEYVRYFMNELSRVGQKIESAWRGWHRDSRGFRNDAGCYYNLRRRRAEGKKNSWSTRLAHIVQGIEVVALHAVVSAFPEQMLILEHDGWTSRDEMDKQAVENVIEKAVGFRLPVRMEPIRAPKLLQCTGKTSNTKAA